MMIDEQHLAEIFYRFDKDKDGSLTELQLGALLRSLGLKPDQQQLESLLERADTNNNGMIEFQEFVNLVLANPPDDKVSNPIIIGEDDDDDDLKRLPTTAMFYTEEQLRSLFRAFDSDGNGYVSETELANSMARLGHVLSEQELAEMMKEADTDGDGQISYEEFAAAITFAAYEAQNKI